MTTRAAIYASPLIMTDHLEEILLRYFRYTSFRGGQKEIIQSVMNRQDALAVLPTGGGKSLCYQIPALALSSMVIVISPLIALMKDQVSQLQKRGIPCGAIYSGQDPEEKRRVFQSLKNHEGFLLYLSPERAHKESFHQWLKEQKLGLIAIDEAHCVSQWGHDFRPEYTELKRLKQTRPDVPVLALTASATPLVLSDISKHLGLCNPSRHVHGFYRSNLYYQVIHCQDDEEKLDYIRQAIHQFPTGRILIYCGTRKLTQDVAATLRCDFHGVDHYHAGLLPEDRSRIQQDYSDGHTRILACTNAFGMGIDHPDVRLVIHHNMPSSIDALYQEMGRAGRDGQESTCLLLYGNKDKSLQSYFIQSSEAPDAIKKSRWNTLNALLDYVDSHECRHAEILTYYKDSKRLMSCGHCDSCLPQSNRKIQPPRVFKKRVLKEKPLIVKGRTAIDNGPLSDVELMRFQLLREWRKIKAAELDVPAFVVLSDRSLRETAKANPASIEALSRLHGFGSIKTEKFGHEVLQAIGQM